MDTRWIPLLRPNDLLVLWLELVNLRLEQTPAAHLRRIDPASPAYLTFVLPPQALTEEVEGPTAASTRRTRAANPSRLVFRVPAATERVPYTLDALLDWNAFEPILGTTAPDRTIIEAPYRLELSLPEGSSWELAPPIPDANPVPLWIVGFRSPSGSRSTLLPPIEHRRGDILRYRTSLTADSRNDIEERTRIGGVYAASSRLLELSSLGAWADLAGDWAALGRPGLQAWEHRIAMGREHDVMTVGTGTLYPFGHRAAIVESIRRVFQPDPVLCSAELQTQSVILIREPVREYDALPLPSRRMLPFRQVEIVTRQTPPFRADAGPAVWPMANDSYIRFECIGVDWDGHRSTFSMPLLFVRDGQVAESTLLDAWSRCPEAQREAWLQNQTVAFASGAESTGAPGDRSFLTETVRFRGVGSATAGGGYRPEMVSARVRIRALDVLTRGGPATQVAYNQTVYRTEGLGNANPGKVLLDILPNGQQFPAIGLRNDESGGVSAPRLAIKAISQSLGPVGAEGASGVEAFARGQIACRQQIEAYLKSVLGETKILGILSLDEIIQAGDGDLFGMVPLTKTYEESGALVTEFRWKTSFLPPGGSATVADAATCEQGVQPIDSSIAAVTATMDLAVRQTAPLIPGEHTIPAFTTMTGKIENLHLKLGNVMTIVFREIEFSRDSGGKSSFSAKVAADGVLFDGSLEFLDKLQPFLKLSLDSGPKVEVTPHQLSVGYGIAIPTIGMGVMVLQNVAISAALTLPFAQAGSESAVTFTFSFCTPERPFQLSIYGLGGGGSAMFALNPAQITRLQISLDFGAIVALDLVVASGSASVTAGIQIDVVENSPRLTGRLRVVGALSVLGLITVSAEFLMELNWIPEQSVVEGYAELTIGVEILGFSKTISLHVKRSFSTKTLSLEREVKPFASRQDWQTYRDAFVA